MADPAAGPAEPTADAHGHCRQGDAHFAAGRFADALASYERVLASRAAGGLLRVAGLPELVTGDAAAYEALALRLATERALLAALRARLERNRGTCALFDTDRFRRHLEAAFVTMWERHQRGEPASPFAVAPQR